MFDRLVGNENAKQILRRLIAEKRVPHSMIFAGADGIGKREFALEIAKSFVCKSQVNGEACDKCAACLRAATFVFPKAEDTDHKDEFARVIFSNHPDVGTVIPYKNNILVDAIRDLEKEANFLPFESSARFFVIDRAEKLNAQKDAAATALLKTLEEPEPSTFLFLVTSRPESLLPTIISRCQILRFAPVNAIEIERFLISKKEFSKEDATLRARLASGSPSRAIKIDLIRFRAQRKLALGVLESLIIENNVEALLSAGEEMNSAANKEHYVEALETLEQLIHDLLKLKTENPGIVNADIKKNLESLAQEAKTNHLLNWITEIEQLRGRFLVNVNKKIATDALFMTMSGK